MADASCSSLKPDIFSVNVAASPFQLFFISESDGYFTEGLMARF
jgi:hypothetical protein